MVSVAQLVERRIVIPVVVGSIPIAHPTHATGISRKFLGCKAIPTSSLTSAMTRKNNWSRSNT